jgi:hypothetical protein
LGKSTKKKKLHWKSSKNYVPTPQRNPMCEKNLNALEKRTLLGQKDVSSFYEE